VRLDPQDARGLRRAEPDREDRSERDRHFPEDVSRLAPSDDLFDPVGQPDCLDPSFEQAEERSLGALMGGELPRGERDVGGGAREPLALGLVEPCEDRDAADVLGRDHRRRPRAAQAPAVRTNGAVARRVRHASRSASRRCGSSCEV